MRVSDGNRDGNGGSCQQSEAAIDNQPLWLIRSELGIRYACEETCETGLARGSAGGAGY
jgi:hypothetical protein